MMLIVPMSGCYKDSQIQIEPTPVVCDILSPLVDAHQSGLLEDGGPVSLQTGVRLIAGYDGSCS